MPARRSEPSQQTSISSLSFGRRCICLILHLRPDSSFSYLRHCGWSFLLAAPLRFPLWCGVPVKPWFASALASPNSTCLQHDSRLRKRLVLFVRALLFLGGRAAGHRGLIFATSSITHPLAYHSYTAVTSINFSHSCSTRIHVVNPTVLWKYQHE